MVFPIEHDYIPGLAMLVNLSGAENHLSGKPQRVHLKGAKGVRD